MKKILFFAALAATMASCTNEVALDVSKSYAIGFDTYVGKTTRAGDLNTASLTSFYVYGGTSASEFKGTQVTKQNDVWTYYPAQYWEEGAKYKFAAVAPVNKDASYDYASGKLTVANYAGGDDDLIVATTNEITGKASGSNDLVGLNFKHALSKVQISFSGLDASKTLSNVKINNVSNKATLEVGYNTGTAPSWGTASSTGSFDYTINATTGKGVKYLLPQALAGNTTITYTYDGKDISLDIKTEDVAAWEIGKAYNYNISLTNENAIDFKVTVAEWPTFGDEPAQTEPETPEEPGNTETPEEPSEEPGETTAPETKVLTPTGDTWIRGNSDEANNATDSKMAIRNNSNGTDIYYSLIEFTLPENLKQDGYKISANLRLVTVQCKGNRNVNLYEYTGSDFAESSTYKNIGTTCKSITEGTAIASFEAKGTNNCNMKDIDASTTFTDDDRTAANWTNNIDLSEYVNGKNNGSKFVLLISRATQDNAEMQFGTKEAKDIPNKDNASLLYFKAEDLKPQLTITYTKEAE